VYLAYVETSSTQPSHTVKKKFSDKEVSARGESLHFDYDFLLLDSLLIGLDKRISELQRRAFRPRGHDSLSFTTLIFLGNYNSTLCPLHRARAGEQKSGRPGSWSRFPETESLRRRAASRACSSVISSVRPSDFHVGAPPHPSGTRKMICTPTVTPGVRARAPGCRGR
jgi:hypothetical protein